MDRRQRQSSLLLNASSSLFFPGLRLYVLLSLSLCIYIYVLALLCRRIYKARLFYVQREEDGREKDVRSLIANWGLAPDAGTQTFHDQHRLPSRVVGQLVKKKKRNESSAAKISQLQGRPTSILSPSLICFCFMYMCMHNTSHQSCLYGSGRRGDWFNQTRTI